MMLLFENIDSLDDLLKKAEKEYLDGGLADNKSSEKYDKQQIEMGKKVELEHTDNPGISKEIAKDHLEEIPDYYTRLKEMEDEYEESVSSNKAASAKVYSFMDYKLIRIANDLLETEMVLSPEKSGDETYITKEEAKGNAVQELLRMKFFLEKHKDNQEARTKLEIIDKLLNNYGI